MEIETSIAKEAFNAVQQRNPEANYHKMSYADLKRLSLVLTGILI